MPFAAIVVLVSVDAMVVGKLGREDLAGLSLVFPLLMLSQSMAAGGLGSAIGSAIARALGMGDAQRARTLALHGILIAFAAAELSTLLMLTMGQSLFATMGATNDVLRHATAYGTIVFLGASAPWLLNVTASIARGTGNMTTPALAMALSAGAYIGLCPPLTLGVGSFQGFGIAGTALAFVISYSVGTLAIVHSLFSRSALLQLRVRDFVPQRTAFYEILSVGTPGAANAAMSGLTVLVSTGFVGHLGPAALAGYGLGTRLEYLVIPLSFAVGTVLVTVVGANVGAHNIHRAKRAAWTGGVIAAAATSIVGGLAAFAPHVWLGLFTNDADIIQFGAVYLRTVGGFYGFFGLGLALYFAWLGVGRATVPVTATMVRLAVVTGGVYLAGHSFTGVCAVVAVAFVAYGMTIAISTMLASWRQPAL